MSLAQTEFDYSPAPAGFPMECSESDMSAKVVSSKEPCPCCGVTAALNPHVLCVQKIAVLRTMLVLHALGNKWVRVEAGRNLIGDTNGVVRESAYRAREHVSRLAWFGIAETKGNRTSLWRVTQTGLNFMAGIVKVSKKILCRQGQVMWKSVEKVGVHDVDTQLDKQYWDNYPWQEISMSLTKL